MVETNAEETFANNSFEWRCKGIASKEENQQSIPLDQLRQWLNRYGDEGAFFISLSCVEERFGQAVVEALDLLGFLGRA